MSIIKNIDKIRTVNNILLKSIKGNIIENVVKKEKSIRENIIKNIKKIPENIIKPIIRLSYRLNKDSD